MALFKSQFVTQASGSIGGATFTRTRSGMVLRARAMPVNPASQYQQAVRSAQSVISSNWQTTLTDLQREGWTNYAAQVSRKNKLGDTIYLTGQQMFVRCNVPRIQAGLPVIYTAPTSYTVGDPPGFLTVSTEPNAGGNTLYVAWTNPNADEGDKILFYVAKPTANTINFFKGPFRFSDVTDLGEGSHTLPESTLQLPIDVGNKVWVRARISYADGRLSDAVIDSARAEFPIPGTDGSGD